MILNQSETISPSAGHRGGTSETTQIEFSRIKTTLFFVL
jgi:hypothetical protein